MYVMKEHALRLSVEGIFWTIALLIFSNLNVFFVSDIAVEGIRYHVWGDDLESMVGYHAQLIRIGLFVNATLIVLFGAWLRRLIVHWYRPDQTYSYGVGLYWMCLSLVPEAIFLFWTGFVQYDVSFSVTLSFIGVLMTQACYIALLIKNWIFVNTAVYRPILCLFILIGMVLSVRYFI